MNTDTWSTKTKFPAKREQMNKNKKTWKRPIVSKYINLTQVSDIMQNIQAAGDHNSEEDSDSSSGSIHVYKYKKVENKVRPVPAVMPEDVKVTRKFPEDPLKNLATLPTHPPEFIPSERLTQERMDSLKIK